MLQETIEPAWIQAFETVLRRCALQPGAGDTVAVLCESQSRPVLAELARHAAARIGCRAFSLMLASVFEPGRPPARSTGASDAIQNLAPVVAVLPASTLLVDCTVEGLMHAPELPAILKGGARVLYVSNEHPEALARLVPDDGLEPLVKDQIYSTGANEVAGRHTRGHFDLPVRNCTVSLDGVAVVEQGRVLA